MKIIKKLSPIMESISNVGKKKPLKEGFYEGGFPNFEVFMDVVYEGNTYGDHDVEFPHFSKTIDLIDSIWKEKYSDKETWDQIPFTTAEKDEIFKSAQNEAKSWDNMDLYNSHARYNNASIREIKKAIRDAFNVQNKYLHESLKKKIDEEFDVNHPIGVLPHADAVAMEQHIADRAAGLERRANPDKDPLVKELIDETASEKSRTLHYDVVDRKGLAKILTEAKKNNQKFKVGKSNKEGYRYFVDILPVYGSKGALEGDDGDTEVDVLTESLNKGEACFKKVKGVPGYMVNDEGTKKFLKNYSEDQVKNLGFKIIDKKPIKEDFDEDTTTNDNNTYYVYEFYYPEITDEDKDVMGDYNLEILGKTGKSRDEENLAVKGKLDDLKAYCEDYLDYEMHPDYLIPEDDFVGDYYDEESLEESKENSSKNIRKELEDYINWCKLNKKEAKDYKSLEDYLNQSKLLKEAKYKTPINDSEDYINALYKAYKALSKRKTGYAAVYGYSKDKKFTPLLSIKDSQDELNKVVDSLKTREKGATDVTVYTLFKNKLDDVKDLLKEKGLLKESLNESVQGKYSERLWDALNQGILDYETVAEAAIHYLSDDEVEDLARANDWVDIFEDPEDDDLDENDVYDSYKDDDYYDEDSDDDEYEDTDEYEDDDEDDELDEDLHVYTSSLKDFKPAKEAEDLWNEIIEKGKLDDLEYELENVFKADDDKNASIDIEGLNDLLVNHQDFIRTLIGLDDAPLEDDDYDEEPVGDNEMVYYEDDEEPVDDDVPLEREDDDVDYREIGDIDDSYIDDDEEPIDYEDKKPFKWKKLDSDEEEIPEDKEEKKEEEEKPESKEEDKEEKKEEKVEESLDKKEPEIKLDDEEDLDEGCNKDLKECDVSKDDDLTENIANSFIKNKFTEAKDMSGMTDEEKRQELARKSLDSLNESDEEVIDINDKELTEALGMPTEDQVKKEEPKTEQPKPEESKEEDKKGE